MNTQLDPQYTVNQMVRYATDPLDHDSNISIVMLIDSVTSKLTSWDVYKWIHSKQPFRQEFLEQLSNTSNHIKL